MGSRGRSAEDTNNQVNMRHLLARAEIEDIRNKAMQQRLQKKGMEGMEGGAGGEHGQVAKKKCVCCFHYSLPAYSEYEICPICGWIDDPIQNANPDLAPGSNPISLHEAQEEWRAKQAR